MSSSEDKVQLAEADQPGPAEDPARADTTPAPAKQGLRKTEALIGTTIAGRYTLTAKIGAGGMGVVYKATQGAVERDVAIKVLLPELVDDESLVARFHLEAKAASRLVHPNTITVFDFGQHEDLLFIAMEFLEGQSLSRVLQQGPLPPARVVKIMLQALRSLAEAHTKGVIHRDIKPDNLFLTKLGDESDFVKVLDFGVAKLHGSQQKTLTQAGMIFGTPTYMSPEQARCQPLDPRSDIYALGVLMYEMLLGQCPFTAEEPVGLLLKHVTEPPPSFDELRPDLQIPKPIEAVVMKALEKDRDARYQTADEMANHLELVARDLQITYGTSVLPMMQGATPVPGVPETEELRKTRAADLLGIGAPITEQATVVGTLGANDLFSDGRQPEPEEAGLTPEGEVGWSGDLRLDLSATIPPRSAPARGLSKNVVIFLGIGIAVTVALIAVILFALFSSSDEAEPPTREPLRVVEREPDIGVEPERVEVLDAGLDAVADADFGETEDAGGDDVQALALGADAGPDLASGDKQAPSVAADPVVKKARGDEDTKRRDQTFTLTVTTVPAGATIFEGGVAVGVSRASLTRKSGSILDVVVKKSGYQTFRRPVPLTRSDALRVTLKAVADEIKPVKQDEPPAKPKVTKPTGDEIPEDIYGDP